MSTRQTRAPRLAWAILILCAISALAVFGVVQAQSDAPRRINVGDTLSGSLDAQNFVRIYTFDAADEQQVTIAAAPTTNALTLALVLSDASGRIVTQITNPLGGEVRIPDQTLAAGTYFITVMRGAGSTEATGQYTISLEGQAPVAQTLNLTRGLAITLNWGTTDDLDIEVRDPVGGSVYFNNPSVLSGGNLSGNANNGCTSTLRNPAETVSWGRGAVPAGSYEVLVYHNRVCEQSAATVDFTVTVSVEGQAQTPVQGRLNLNEQYVFSFVLSAPNTVTLREGGANPLLLNLSPFATDLASPTELGAAGRVQGRIDNNNPVDVWSFSGTANQVVTVDMQAILGGSLDPQLILLDSRGNVIASNDDSSNATRNALISQKVLPADDTYLVVATRFGKNIGGTEGSYSLAVTFGGNVVQPVGTPVPGATAVVSPITPNGLPSGSITVSLTWNNKADVRLLVRDPQNRSLFSDVRQISGGGILERQDNLNCQNTVEAPVTYAYWPNDPPLFGTYEVQVWMNNQCNEPVPPTYTLVVSVRGQEVLRQTNRPDLSRNISVITFSVDAQGNATAGTGGIFTRQLGTDVGDISTRIPTAEALIYGRPASGVIDATTPFVVYTFQARAGDRVRISLRSVTGTLDPFVYLLDGAGLQLAANDDVQPGKDANSRIDQIIPADGGYIVVATRFGALFGGTSGSFEISITPN